MLKLISGYCRERIHSVIDFSSQKEIASSRKFEVLISRVISDQVILSQSLKSGRPLRVPFFFAGLSFYRRLHEEGEKEISYLRLMGLHGETYYFFYHGAERAEVLEKLNEIRSRGIISLQEGTAFSTYHKETQSIHIFFPEGSQWTLGRDDVRDLFEEGFD